MPRRLEVAAPAPALREDDLLWLPLTDIEGAPLPAPVLALLREVAGAAAGAAASGATARRRGRTRA